MFLLNRFFWAALFIILGLFCAASLPWIYLFQLRAYESKEPFFLIPVATYSGQVLLRNDVYGKGYFGAPRNGGRTHQGIDLLTELEGPIYASKSGRVSFSGEGKGYGLYLEIGHPEGKTTRYAHLASLEVGLGDWVTAGQLIAKAGKTGNASASKILPHLHYEIREKKRALNPLPDLMDPRYKIN